MAKKKYKSYLIVDGYNIINDWEELKILSAEDLDAARERLIHYIIEYSQYHGKKAIIVFDAYNVKGGTEKRENRKYISLSSPTMYPINICYIYYTSVTPYSEIKFIYCCSHDKKVPHTCLMQIQGTFVSYTIYAFLTLV